MLLASVIEDDDMALYVPPEKPWMLRLRSTDVFKAKLDGVVRLWKAHAEARGDDAKQVDASYVVRRLLEAGIDQAFAEYGGYPRDEDAWKSVESAIAKSVKKSR
jgi:hypothetical protein